MNEILQKLQEIKQLIEKTKLSTEESQTIANKLDEVFYTLPFARD